MEHEVGGAWQAKTALCHMKFNSVGAPGPSAGEQEGYSPLYQGWSWEEGRENLTPKAKMRGLSYRHQKATTAAEQAKAPVLFSPCCVERVDEKSLLTPADPCHPSPSKNSLTRWQVWRSQGSPEGGLLCLL